MSTGAWRIEDALNRAIEMEKQSYSLYVGAQEIATYPESKQMLKELAEDEKRHRERLEKAKNSGEISQLGALQKVTDLGILNHVSESSLSQESTYQDILIFAGKREKETHDYYSEMASRLHNTATGGLFERLAQEELGHKAKIEREYERIVLKEG